MKGVLAFKVQVNLRADGSASFHWGQLRRQRLAAKRYLRNEMWQRRMIRTTYGVSEYVAASALAKWRAMSSEERAQMRAAA